MLIGKRLSSTKLSVRGSSGSVKGSILAAFSVFLRVGNNENGADRKPLL